ncbi:hypothetical protein [Neoaquamicrobium sediminum]|uniref:hypothetical protein n=1 Tax=Neoaquamicrobium sediminum TaxID=1849104 RepID=UPI0015649E52|nr:hypothetical protein [Mesorhizobium sediminum]NRC54151.1 hypothetical protein [Mesorhizobium sediminum]
MSLLSTLRPELDATGLPWSTSVGTKHIKLYLGARLVGILPHNNRASDRDRRAHLNIRAQIRRAARDMK